jgi:hypothetical protein
MTPSGTSYEEKLFYEMCYAEVLLFLGGGGVRIVSGRMAIPVPSGPPMLGTVPVKSNCYVTVYFLGTRPSVSDSDLHGSAHNLFFFWIRIPIRIRNADPEFRIQSVNLIFTQMYRYVFFHVFSEKTAYSLPLYGKKMKKCRYIHTQYHLNFVIGRSRSGSACNRFRLALGSGSGCAEANAVPEH